MSLSVTRKPVKCGNISKTETIDHSQELASRFSTSEVRPYGAIHMRLLL